MNNQNPTYDWMLVTVRGYDPEKGYIFGNRHPDGKGVIIAKKHSVRRDWVKALSSEKDRTFTPPQSVIAVFGAEEKDSTLALRSLHGRLPYPRISDRKMYM